MTEEAVLSISSGPPLEKKLHEGEKAENSKSMERTCIRHVSDSNRTTEKFNDGIVNKKAIKDSKKGRKHVKFARRACMEKIVRRM